MRIQMLAALLSLCATPTVAESYHIEGTGGWHVSVTPADGQIEGQCAVTRNPTGQSRDFSGQGFVTSGIHFDLTRGDVGIYAFRAPLELDGTLFSVGGDTLTMTLGKHRVRAMIERSDSLATLAKMFDGDVRVTFGADWIDFDTKGLRQTFLIAWYQCPENLIGIEAPDGI